MTTTYFLFRYHRSIGRIKTKISIVYIQVLQEQAYMLFYQRKTHSGWERQATPPMVCSMQVTYLSLKRIVSLKLKINQILMLILLSLVTSKTALNCM